MDVCGISLDKVSRMSEEYYSVLARTLVAVEDDPALLRGTVYKLARVELERQLNRRYELEKAEQIAALEQAIGQSERDLKGSQSLPAASLERIETGDEDSGGSHSTAVAIRRSGPEIVTPQVLPPLVTTWPSTWPYEANRPFEPPEPIETKAKFWWRFELLIA